MQLTKIQRRALRRARELRDQPFPVFNSMLRSWKQYLVYGAAIGLYSWWSWSVGAEEVGIASLGFLAGLLLRDVAWLRAHARLWPVNVEITDWSKVDSLLDERTEA